MQAKVELNKATLFALASDTRLQLLRALQTERRTLSQLAELVEVDKAAVHRHLRKLEDGDLVRKTDDHGFIYYSLTWKARDLISPGENTRIVVLISTALVLGAIFLILMSVALTGVPGVGEYLGNGDSGTVEQYNEAVREIQYALYVAAGAAAVLALAAAYIVKGMLYKPLQDGAESSEDWEGPEGADIPGDD